MNIFNIIPAKGNSNRLKNKNIYELNGKPLLQWTLEAAKKSKYLDRIFVSTESSTHIPIGLVISLVIFFELLVVIGGWKFKPDLMTTMSLSINENITNTHSLGSLIYTDYIHIFQLSGMILLVAMIGAIVLTFRQRSGIKRQSYFTQISREKAEGVQLVDVESNKGVNLDD